MSNEEEKRCPLCAEEMDWTDQQFKPCKCGYQVCVWCWHHLIDMAEKEETEGRCPACRTIYEKEKIVAAQANCERTSSKNCNRKTRPPKVKPKTNEAKKDLTNVRVIQRRMAYVIGLPVSLADEDLLQRKEYFGQYGKVTKVSLSRTAGGTIQQFVNDTCSVYITYSKEEEALRCIQSVHGFALEDRVLRASFGTAKYCHAWLKNMPCNNSACLYLHSIGADEDSFGKDEVAAVHTRSRVQQMVGVANTALRRFGNVLPPPMDDLYNSSASFPDRSNISSPLDSTHGSVNSSVDMTCSNSYREGEGSIDVPQKVTSFVDVVGRPNSSGPEKDGNHPDDKRTLNLCSEFSSVAIGGSIHTAEPYSAPTLFKVSSSNRIGNGVVSDISDELHREDSSLFDSEGVKDAGGLSQMSSLLSPTNTENTIEGSGCPASIQKKTRSLNDIASHNYEDEASVPIKCVNMVSNDVNQEMKFQNSTKSDRIYRNSNSFSNEEILEHLRRIEDDNLGNDEEDSALNVVESSIISNIMSIDFDSGDDSLMPGGLSEFTDYTDGLRDSSWNSFNSDQSGYSFVKQDDLASQVAGSVLPDFGDNKNQYIPQYPETRTQCLAPPGFSFPTRDPPPGFSACERTSLPRPPSGSHLVNASSYNSLLQQPGTGFSSSINDVDFVDPAILSCGKTTNEFKTPSLEMRLSSNTPQMNTFGDDARLWYLIQQSAHQDSKFSQMFTPMPQTSSVQQELSYTGRMGTGLSPINGLSSRLVNQHQNYDPSNFVQQKFGNGHISNTNGYLHGINEFRHKGEVGVTENEMLGLDKYLPGYGDLMFSSGDVYSRIFGL